MTQRLPLDGPEDQSQEFSPNIENNGHAPGFEPAELTGATVEQLQEVWQSGNPVALLTNGVDMSAYVADIDMEIQESPEAMPVIHLRELVVLFCMSLRQNGKPLLLAPDVMSGKHGLRLRRVAIEGYDSPGLMVELLSQPVNFGEEAMSTGSENETVAAMQFDAAALSDIRATFAERLKFIQFLLGLRKQLAGVNMGTMETVVSAVWDCCQAAQAITDDASAGVFLDKLMTLDAVVLKVVPNAPFHVVLEKLPALLGNAIVRATLSKWLAAMLKRQVAMDAGQPNAALNTEVAGMLYEAKAEVEAQAVPWMLFIEIAQFAWGVLKQFRQNKTA